MKADHERRRKQATFEFVNAVSDRYKTALHAFDARHGVNVVVDIASYDEDDRSSVRSYLSEMERICAGVNSGVFDYQILRKMMSSVLIARRERFGQYIAEAQSRTPTLYCELDAVVARLLSDRAQPRVPEATIRHS